MFRLEGMRESLISAFPISLQSDVKAGRQMRAGLSGAQPRSANLLAVFGPRLDAFPYVHRILLENLVRHSPTDSDAHRALTLWVSGETPRIELPFRPGRIMMHDTTCVPALVDLAALRSNGRRTWRGRNSDRADVAR